MADLNAWAKLSHVLGLVPYERTASYSHGASFKQVKRSLAAPRTNQPSFAHYLYGVRNGVELVVRTYDEGSGSSQTTYTGVLARIDPPLFLGLGIARRGAIERLFKTPTMVLSNETAAALNVTGFDEARIRELFANDDPSSAQVLAELVNLSQWEMRISDSVVSLAEQGTITDVGKITWFAENASRLARWLSVRRMRLAASPSELAQQAEWRAFAEERHLSLDVARMQLTGEVSGSAMEIALETDGQDVVTAVTARFRSEVPVGFTVQRTGLPSFLQGVFNQDINIGHRAFDELYRVTGYPEPHVRALLAKPELLDLLVRLAPVGRELQLNHGGIFYRIPGSSPRASDLWHHAEALRIASEAFFGAARELGPYR
jgi:hypothetical protein